MATYLDFEDKIKQIEEDILVAKSRSDEPAVNILEKKLEKEVQKTFKNLNDYQKLQLARHPDRPYALDYIRGLLTDAYEIHGDRHYVDDNAIVCFLGYIGQQKVMVIGEQKGRGTKNKLKRNFGMPSPEGYRKALRCAKMAEKFGIPILMLVDTPGAYPGIGAEERNQSEAIAKNLYEFSNLKTPTVSVVIGEGGSGGALAISVADKLAMMRYSVYAVISPEGCAAILWNDPAHAETAANSLKITAEALKSLELIDDVIEEPLIGAHKRKEEAIQALGDYFLNSLAQLKEQSVEERLNNRYEKLMKLGKFESDKK
ncbi:acetyl-CoA carboxylase carboxyl transferase subunit alpha [Malaciobacter molluscorum LMG 25693]|uniref:Acetyl-coenzyme A carboxylase carboxyl transferase subunit alpha n=1 Tax=Malaciobacter molluscorum LMG 25693 TaxID=870501 RepID=A0A2G1DKC0_9BACT|nr:acetyl-CoA carboxylase carboxyl transferase subunit alpha [Malaciobacter molluscorum]AXX91347.1 acetyl-CoA carboxylase, carboxyltransferase, alpha subunit [Malaciobacter molluscorum LMG 25693]PHO18900.1 acetyl-CoA carboxylase carboxyl transferase subunit alpha [Malaciobacter molluscorum LMG 25693]RXJ94349.1 acetyl-CoA carboxylase carboxyl transferase subunit alpha [Malaciobacter molluscorum]